MNNPDVQLTTLVKDVLTRMGIAGDVSVQIPEDSTIPLTVSIQASENGRFLIGKNGQNLSALEHVIRAMWSRQAETPRTISVDVNDYRQARVAELTETARQAATRVRDNRRSEALGPMSSYERRIIHAELSSWGEVTTESVGQEPQRRVVIKPL